MERTRGRSERWRTTRRRQVTRPFAGDSARRPSAKEKSRTAFTAPFAPRSPGPPNLHPRLLDRRLARSRRLCPARPQARRSFPSSREDPTPCPLGSAPSALCGAGLHEPAPGEGRSFGVTAGTRRTDSPSFLGEGAVSRLKGNLLEKGFEGAGRTGTETSGASRRHLGPRASEHQTRKAVSCRQLPEVKSGLKRV